MLRPSRLSDGPLVGSRRFGAKVLSPKPPGQARGRPFEKGRSGNPAGQAIETSDFERRLAEIEKAQNAEAEAATEPGMRSGWYYNR
jgi:hypothetical protein